MKKEKKSSVSKSMPKIQPLGDKVLIKELEAETTEKTAGGIFIPDTVKEDRGSKKGEVLAVGPGKYDDGVLVPMEVKVGDTVLYSGEIQSKSKMRNTWS